MFQLRRILVPSDFSDLSLHALAYSRAFAEKFAAELHVIHVVDEAYQYWMTMGPNSLPVMPIPDEMVASAKPVMDEFVGKHLAGFKLPLKTDVLMGTPFREIVRYAKDKEIGLIILGTHGRGGLSHVLLGSVTEKVVRKAPCPVLTVHHPELEFVMP